MSNKMNLYIQLQAALLYKDEIVNENFGAENTMTDQYISFYWYIRFVYLS